MDKGCKSAITSIIASHVLSSIVEILSSYSSGSNDIWGKACVLRVLRGGDISFIGLERVGPRDQTVFCIHLGRAWTLCFPWQSYLLGFCGFIERFHS